MSQNFVTELVTLGERVAGTPDEFRSTWNRSTSSAIPHTRRQW